ncbi:hypothetical protein IWW38_004905, partial [Coemansia aciculifera]
DLFTPERLNDIKHGVATKASTWGFLRSQFPPKHSELASLYSDATNGDDYDIAFSQAATMTAYAIELLQDATDSQN